jgi:hypothetical protein
VFIVIVNLVSELYPFSNHKKFDPEEVMIIMTDEKNHIVEINKCVNNVIGMDSAFVA